MTEVLFYHLERQPLERVLPQLISKTLERGWRAVIQAGSEERVEAISMALWITGEESLQPVWVTDQNDNPNGATIRFLVDGAKPGDMSGLDRVVYLFDGRDAEAVAEARSAWKASQAQGHAVTYWKEDAQGRWQKQA